MSGGLQFINVEIKNFLSFGNMPTNVDLTGNGIVAVLGVNEDSGGEESRNGVGKSTIVDAISYALFGKTVRGISNPKLVNKLSDKGQEMRVVLEFTAGDEYFRVERGEKPSRLRFFRQPIDDEKDILSRDGKTFIYDVSRNKNETTEDIVRVVGFDIKLFEFLIANTSESIPFMQLEESKKREIAERLMGLNILTERAERVKDRRRDDKKELIAEDSKLETMRRANERVESQINEMKAREEAWVVDHGKKIDAVMEKIANLSSVDIGAQKKLLEMMSELSERTRSVENELREKRSAAQSNARDLSDLRKIVGDLNISVTGWESDKTKIESGVCPTCDQTWIPSPEVIQNLVTQITEARAQTKEVTDAIPDIENLVTRDKEEIENLEENKKSVDAERRKISETNMRYRSLDELGRAEQSLTDAKREKAGLEEQTNPHTESVAGLNTTLGDVDDTRSKHLSTMIRHYDYLVELLQSKDSFVRKAVIDCWLPQLNGRIAHYLETLELPYRVRVENDLTMSIQDFGEEFDWGNLSRGQRQRVTIALNLAFQDLFEATNHPLGLLIVDELVDAGICSRGAQQAVSALEDSAKNKDKKIFLITHRTDIADRIDDVMTIKMRNRISRVEMSGNGE